MLCFFAYRMDARKSRSDTLRSLNHWKLLLHISFQLYIFAHRNKPRVRDKVLTDVKPKSEHLFVIGWMLCIFCPTGLVFCSGKPLRRSVLTIQKTQMWFISIFIHVCERLFDELVKELALDRFVIVSGSVREKNGKAVRFRKAHLRRRRRWCLSYRSRPVLFTSGLAKEGYFRLRIPLCGLKSWSYIPALQSLWLWTLRLTADFSARSARSKWQLRANGIVIGGYCIYHFNFIHLHAEIRANVWGTRTHDVKPNRAFIRFGYMLCFLFA